MVRLRGFARGVYALECTRRFCVASMKTRLNLASQPFRNRALPWTVTAIISIASVLALIFILRATFQTNAQAQSIERDVKNMQSQADAVKRRAEDVKESLTADQLRTLKAAHALVDRKRF